MVLIRAVDQFHELRDPVARAVAREEIRDIAVRVERDVVHDLASLTTKQIRRLMGAGVKGDTYSALQAELALRRTSGRARLVANLKSWGYGDDEQ